ncbi:hypothetical protein H4Q26_006572 [Puccinia striiformis f. sp. tritici PST-130]|nr:hypothetical protein H4Q26_006572 [Puccinia striiformis f. sp. tritici PST-130]
MLNNIPQEGTQANNNFPMPTAEEYYQMAATVQRLKVSAAAPPPPPQHIEAVQKTHDSDNPECAILTSNGSNFQVWEEEVNQTLDSALGKDEAKSVVTLFRTTISKELQTIVGGLLVKTPLEMYRLIKTNCKHSDRQHKLRLVDRLTTLIKSKAPGTDVTLSSWTSIVTHELEQLKVLISE